MKSLGMAFVCLATLGMGFALGTYRERSILLPRIECAYHEGSNEGYNTGMADARAHSAKHVEEDSPGWDCHTMGNKKCGPKVAQGKK